jgi:hypothetical protein
MYTSLQYLCVALAITACASQADDPNGPNGTGGKGDSPTGELSYTCELNATVRLEGIAITGDDFTRTVTADTGPALFDPIRLGPIGQPTAEVRFSIEVVTIAEDGSVLFDLQIPSEGVSINSTFDTAQRIVAMGGTLNRADGGAYGSNVTCTRN